MQCTSKKVRDFYDTHTNLNFETMNILLVDILEELSKDISSSMSNNIASQLLTNVQNMQTQINTLNEGIGKMQSDIQQQFVAKFGDFKQDYLKDINMLLNSNTMERLGPLIREYNGSLYDKTFIMLNEIVPKHNEQMLQKIREGIQAFHHSVNEDTNKLLDSSLNQKSLEDFIQKIDNKFAYSQQFFNSIITASEQRLDSKIGDVKAISSTNQQSQSILQSNVVELLKKMEISSVKGKCSENILFNILQSLYSTAQIDVVGDQKETGDIMLLRKNKPTILVENKNWNKNVVQDEVKKFIRDVEIQNCCGLFLSQNHGIANKENFEININNGNVLLYVHEVNNDAEKIRIAIDIIDNFKAKLDECASVNEGYNIDKDVLDEINKEYQLFVAQKTAQIKTVKDFSSKMTKQIDDMQMPSLEHFLSKKYAFSTSKYMCEFCEFVGKNQSAMSAHKRGCKGKEAGLTGKDNSYHALEKCEGVNNLSDDSDSHSTPSKKIVGGKKRK